MTDALTGFLTDECDDELAGELRGVAAVLPERGYECFEFNVFKVELFDADDRVTIKDTVGLGYTDSELSLAEFLSAIPDVPSTTPHPRAQPIILPPPRTDRD